MSKLQIDKGSRKMRKAGTKTRGKVRADQQEEISRLPIYTTALWRETVSLARRNVSMLFFAPDENTREYYHEGAAKKFLYTGIKAAISNKSITQKLRVN